MAGQRTGSDKLYYGKWRAEEVGGISHEHNNYRPALDRDFTWEQGWAPWLWAKAPCVLQIIEIGSAVHFNSSQSFFFQAALLPEIALGHDQHSLQLDGSGVGMIFLLKAVEENESNHGGMIRCDSMTSWRQINTTACTRNHTQNIKLRRKKQSREASLNFKYFPWMLSEK